MKISELQKRSWSISEDKGFHEARDSDTVYALALIHSEVSEALEANRGGKEDLVDRLERTAETDIDAHSELLMEAVDEIEPDPIGEELADIAIRVADLAEEEGVNLEKEIEVKLALNEEREELHGGKNY